MKDRTEPIIQVHYSIRACKPTPPWSGGLFILINKTLVITSPFTGQESDPQIVNHSHGRYSGCLPENCKKT